MYGGLELAERIRLGQAQELDLVQGKPFLKKRGIKFNIPLDARNPSYDDTGDAAQENIASVWDFDFWQQQLDQMALHRYNQLTLWNPQPFTSMLKLEAFPGLDGPLRPFMATVCADLQILGQVWGLELIRIS